MWILLTVCAASFQTVRNSLARSIAFDVHPALTTWSRFAFSLPFSGALVLALAFSRGGWPQGSPAFFAWCLATAVSQLLANVALVSAFRRVNFAESIVLNKLEVSISALLGMLFFSEHPTYVGWLGVAVCTFGVFLINLGRERGPDVLRRALAFDLGSWLALLSGLLLALASFFLKEASQIFDQMHPGSPWGRMESSTFTLFHVTWMESAILGAFLLLAAPSEFRRVPCYFKKMTMIGAAGFAGSFCWFWAYSIAYVAYVKAVGQIEAVNSVVIALFIFRERAVIRQLPGIALVSLGILLVIWD